MRSRPRPGSADRKARTELPGRAAVAAGIAVLVLAGAAFGWLSGRGEIPVAAAVAPPVGPLAASASAAPPPTPPVPAPTAPPTTTPPPDWPAVLDGLDAARARAFAAADLQALADVWAPGSPGLVADTAALQRLAAAGQTAHGVRHDVRDVRAVTVPAVTEQGAADPSAPEASMRLEVVDALGGQEIRDRAGSVVRSVAARDQTGWLIELVRTPTGWRLRSVSPRE